MCRPLHVPRAEAHTQQGLFPQTGLVVLLEHIQAQLELCRLELCRVARTAHVPSLPEAQMDISAQGWSRIQQEAHFACETIAMGPAEVKH